MPGSSQSLKKTGSLVEGQHDINSADRLAGRERDRRLQVMALGHLVRVFVSIIRVRAPHLQLPDLADLAKRVEVSARHPAGADHPDGATVLARQVFHAKPGTTADSVMLQE